MDLTFLKDDPLKNVVLQTDGRPLHSIHTPTKLTHQQTTIRRISTNGDSIPTTKMTVDIAREMEGIAVGGIEWHTLSPSKVAVHSRDITPTVPKWWSASETFISSNGIEYKWSTKKNDLVLTVANDDGHTEVARFKWAKLGIFSAAKPARMEVSQEGVDILDEVIATWVWMEHKRQVAIEMVASAA